jgi:hypothetical protein
VAGTEYALQPWLCRLWVADEDPSPDARLLRLASDLPPSEELHQHSAPLIEDTMSSRAVMLHGEHDSNPCTAQTMQTIH